MIFNLDVQLTRWLNGVIPHNSFFDAIFSFLSGYGSSFLIWILIIGFLIIFEEKRHREFIWNFGLSIFIAGGLTNYILKNFFTRLRPQDLMTTSSYLCPQDFSFPSTHVAVAFAAATILSKYDAKRAGVYYLIAALVGLSRIYLGCHYVLDVVSGALLGYLISKVLVFHRQADFLD